MRYLGIDFGLKHLGFSHAEGPLAEPLTQKSYQSLPQLLNWLNQLIQDQKINKIIIGLPEGQLAIPVKTFGSQLHSLTQLPVDYQDETLSTQEAQAKLLQAHAPQKKRRQDHMAAATQILQTYLDDHFKAC